MPVKVRFAPSPTGYLHVGNVRTALVNWLFARRHGGHFLLRIDDTDAGRSKQEYIDAIKQDLQWLGLGWDSEVHQSQRFGHYRAAADALRAQGRLYACYESAEELDVQRKMLASRGLPPIYNRAALKLTDEQKKKLEAEGRKPHYRFMLNNETVMWDDLIRGETKFNATHMSDPVLLREDGVPVYTLASVVDDGDLAITHVIRGEDHVSNTAVQVQLYRALGYAVPQFAHMALLKTKEGEMSKRLGGNDIRTLRDSGILPAAVNALLARIGTSAPVEAVDMATLVETFDFSKFGRAPANYDVQELEKLNEKLLHQMPFAEAYARFPFITELFWLSVKANIKSLDEVSQWWDILHGNVAVELSDEDKAFVRSTMALLPATPWNEATWDAWLAAIKPTTQRSGKMLFMPLRRALTGRDHGPELKKLLPLLGRDLVMQRLAVQ
jgi:glutamyl-tRNA synthetase